MFISKRQPIHKEFRQARIALFFVDAAVLLSIVLGIALLLLGVYLQGHSSCGLQWPVFLLALAIGIVAVLLNRTLKKPLHQRFVAASGILSSEEPRDATVVFPGVMGWNGLLLELLDPKGPVPGRSIISLAMPKERKPRKGNVEVAVRSDSTGQSSTLVVDMEGRHLVGILRKPKEVCLDLQRTRRLLTALSFATIVGFLAGSVAVVAVENRLSNEISRARQSVNFPTVPAEVFDTTLIETSVRKGKIKKKAWLPQVSTLYTVKSVSHMSQRVTAANEVFFDEALAREVLERYPVGSVHDVFYDPAEHGFAVLEPGHAELIVEERLKVLTTGVLILLVVFCLGAVFVLARRKLVPSTLELIDRVYGSALSSERTNL